ncbi:MAG: histidine phosphatase family protein [Bacteroidetes bacterium]|nr:histidine phosphatase family protein [Bacteroidota bacterium]
MKQLILIRHAKTESGSMGMNDFDRQLTDKGKKAAKEMAARLKQKGVRIDAVFSSNAIRAIATAKAFIKEFSLKEENVLFLNELYLPPPNIFYPIISDAADNIETLAIVSHNDGITDFANTLTNARIDNIPTCGIFAVIAYCNSWKNFENANKEFWFFDTPKSI